MKKIMLTFAAVLSVAALAHADVSVTGAKAAGIAEALDAAGSFGDCGAGKCGTEAFDVQCLAGNNATSKKISYSCSLSTQSYTGGMKSISIKGKLAKNLYNALENAGASGDCGAGTCGIEAKSIQVTYDTSATLDSFEATIQQESLTEQ